MVERIERHEPSSTGKLEVWNVPTHERSSLAQTSRDMRW
jgi:hypothetical protein